MASSISSYRSRLTDPGKRSTIPDAYLKRLNPGLYQKRLTNRRITQENATTYNPMAMLSGDSLRKTAALFASQQYDPQIQSAESDRKLAIKNDAVLAERIAGYYKDANSALATAHENAQGAQGKLAADLAASHSQLNQSMQTDQANAQKFAQDDQALRGTGMDAGLSQRLTADFQRQQQGVQANAQAQENAGNVAGAGWAGLASMMQGAGAIRGADAMSQVANMSANRETKLGQDVAALKGEKGAAQVKFTQDLRGSEFEKSVTASTLDIKQQTADTAAAKASFDAKYKTNKLKADQRYRADELALRRLTQQQAHGDRSAALNARIRDARARLKISAGNLDVAQKRLDLARQKQAGTDTAGNPLPTAKETKGQWLPPVAAAHAISDFHRTLASPTLAKWKKDGLTRPEIADKITEVSDIDPALVSAVLDMMFDHHISNGTAAKLHRAKIKVSGLGVPSAPRKGVVIKNRNTQGTTNKAGGDPTGRFTK